MRGWRRCSLSPNLTIHRKPFRMRQLSKSFLTLLLLCISLSINSQTNKQLLGIPFGAPLHLQGCPSPAEEATAPCWIDSPFFYEPTGERLGAAHLPNPDLRPKWAAYAWFELTLDKLSNVQVVKVTTFNSTDLYQIANSINQRFGKPINSQFQKKGISWATWSSKDGYVDMRCQEKCWIEFRTPSAQRAREAEERERKAVDAARPRAP